MELSCNNELSKLKYGIWIDGYFMWLDNDGWDYKNYGENEMFTNCKVKLSVTIQTKLEEESILQVITIENSLNMDREIKLFFCQNLMEYYENSITFYAPSIQAIIRSYQNQYLLLNGHMNNRGIVQYCTDFEDCCSLDQGVVLMQPISSSSRVSIFSLEGQVKAYKELDAYFWLCKGLNEADILRNNLIAQINLPFEFNIPFCSK